MGFLGDDKTKPTISFTPLGNPFNENNWAKENFFVGVSVEDTESGGNSYLWCSTVDDICDPAQKQESKYGTVLLETESPTNKICVIGTDNNGNNSATVCSQNYQLDKTEPTIEGVTDQKIVRGDVINFLANIKGTDTLSGTNGFIRLEPETVDTTVAGTFPIFYQLNDLAGNEVRKSSVITIIQETTETYFIFNPSTKTITGYSDSGPKDVVIPSRINGVPVENIGNNAFYNKQLTSVMISNSVKSIGSSALEKNQLKSIVIPNNVKTIEQRAFFNNQLTDIVIPNTVTSIGAGAFTNNQLSEEQAFIYRRNSDGTEDFTYLVSYGGAKRDNIVIPNSIVNIGSESFYRCNITSVNIPSNVTFIGAQAFDENQLTTVVLPSKLTTISNMAFQNNKLTTITIPNGVTTIGLQAFAQNKLTNVVLSNTITAIGVSSFAVNQITNIKIPASVKSIEINAFASNQLTSVKIVGKSSSSQFTTYGTGIWGWASGYSDSNITWNAPA